ncbi:MAG: type II toxin-antitoxin system VapB family antitoxin [Candidatus Aminicenantales bacterium]
MHFSDQSPGLLGQRGALRPHRLPEFFFRGGHRTKKETVTQALLEYIQSLEQKKILDLFGRIEFDESYDYRKQRART